MLLKFRLAVATTALIALPSAPAAAAQSAFVYCSWSAAPHTELSVTQIEEIRFDDARNHGIGSYTSALAQDLMGRLGLPSEPRCDWQKTRTYDGREPGGTFRTWDGNVLAISLHKIDPRWFLTEHYKSEVTVVSLGQVPVASDVKSTSLASSDRPKPDDKGPSRVQIGAQERAARAAEREAEFQRKQAAYEAELAEQRRKVAEFEQAKADIAKRKADQAVAAKAAQDDFQKRKTAHDAEVAKYENELAARKVLADFDKRNGLGQASTDTDANRCVTAGETRLDDTFKGNTSASIVNGCGKPVDVRICLMTDKGWNCGDRSGVASQGRATFSSFGATGQVYVDARVTGSGKALVSPQ